MRSTREPPISVAGFSANKDGFYRNAGPYNDSRSKKVRIGSRVPLVAWCAGQNRQGVVNERVIR
jgi:hypothetical protein